MIYIDIMPRKLITVTDDQARRLEALSKKTGAPQAELVRRALEEYLKKQKA
jgi:predicted DNA-binding protein